tara:strand:- start:211 stop:594 length:384 start_codon:yes stop_codon:yes gene_type:complete
VQNDFGYYYLYLGQTKTMAIKTLFLPLPITEVKQQEQNIHDKRDRINTKHKKFEESSVLQLTTRNNSIISQINSYLNPLDIFLNPNGGYQVVSVTPVLETKAEKVDDDEPMMPFVTTTGFLVILHKA